MTIRPALTFVLLGFAGSIPSLAHATTVGPVTELATPMAVQRNPVMSYDPTAMRYIIVWEDDRTAPNGIDLYVARLGLDGTLMDTDGIAVLAGAALVGDELAPDIVYNNLSESHAIVWHEVRSPAAFADVWVTRFLASSGTIVPSAGVQLTTGNDSEGFAVVESTGGNLLVSWQVNIVAGGQAVRGRRILPDLSIVEGAFDVSATLGAGRPAVSAFGSNFFVAYERNADIFGRVIPDTGAIGTPVIRDVVTATRAQTSASVATVGAGNIHVVWDDRRIDGIGYDIYGRRFDTSFLPVAPDTAISGAINNQNRPRIATDVNGGLAVWQDRRNSAANGIIYGTRFDQNGVVEDPDGFPLLAFSGNAFEQTVVKGPGDDFMVAAVRFGTNQVTDPSRIFYRIVRDELPGGTMTGMGTLTVDADGVTPAMVTFGPAVGVTSGLPVVADTMYTVTLSNTAVSIVEPDADPTMAGHQLRSAEGAISLALTSLAHVLCDVTVASVEGNSSGTVTVEFLNVPPVASNVVVGPAMPRSDQALALAYDYEDINSDPEMMTRIRWTRDAEVRVALNDLTSVDAAQTRRGEMWRAIVTPNDGLPLGLGVPVVSNTVEIGNTPPVASNLEVRFRPAMVLVTGTPLTSFYTYTDTDLDPEGPTEIRWYIDGAERFDLFGLDMIEGSEVIKGQTWYLTVRPHDNIEFGALAQSSSVTVQNTAPVAVAGPKEDAERKVLERRDFTLDGRASSDVDPQDTLTYSWRQVITGSEPEIALNDATLASPTFTAPSIRGTVFLRFELIVNDGEEDSNTDFVIIEIEPVPDTDSDGLDDEEEAIAMTDPNNPDTDSDGLRDPAEVEAGTNPLDEDSDDDGIRDGAEGKTCKNCNDQTPLGDPDGDQLINALDPDADNDGLFDGTEIGVIATLNGGGEPPFTYDGTDTAAGNFIADEDPSTTTQPLIADTDLDVLLDGEEDANKNGRVDSGESDPNDPTDPGIACTPGNDDCPPNLFCMGAICIPDDGTNMCEVTLPTTLECCMGGCVAQGTRVDAICPATGSREQCPVGAEQCVANTCKGSGSGPGPDASGCDCTAEGTGRSPNVLVFLVLAVLLIRRRR